MTSESLQARLGPLLEKGVASLDELGLPAVTLEALGFQVERGRAQIPDEVECLSKAAIEAALSGRARRWLKDLETLQIAGSTNTLLNELAAGGRSEGAVRIAELQLAGRGRRGRGWQSPYGQNLALSLGLRMPLTPEGLGGFSLCVGLATVDALRGAGVDDVALKWPNDVLIAGRKVAGILLEIHSAGRETDVIIGIGVNFRLTASARAQIDQPVIDLQELGGRYSRNELAAGLISSVVDFSEGFGRAGFAPMRDAFDRLHWFHGKPCTLLIGGGAIRGRVAGVTSSGALELEVAGERRVFAAGEVSLRPA